jgi:hypothetical protein
VAPVIARDKFGHAAAGAVIACLACLLTRSTSFAALAVLMAAVGKEAWDAMGHGTPDPWDVLATMAGGAPVILIALTL